jgi:hypothetical protein
MVSVHNNNSNGTVALLLLLLLASTERLTPETSPSKGRLLADDIFLEILPKPR